MNLNQCRLTLYAKSNEVNERDPNDTLIGDRLIQDFGQPSGRRKEKRAKIRKTKKTSL